MQARTKMELIDMLAGIVFIFMVYSVGGLAWMDLDIAMNPFGFSFDEPWMWFGELVFLPLGALVYAILCLIALVYLINDHGKYREQCEGKAYKPLKQIVSLYDFYIVGGFILFSPYICRQLYPVIEDVSDTTMAILSLVPFITCLSIMVLLKRAFARFGSPSRWFGILPREERQ